MPGSPDTETSGVRPWQMINLGDRSCKPSEGWEAPGQPSMEKGHSQASCIIQGTGAAWQGPQHKVCTGSQVTPRKLLGD